MVLALARAGSLWT